MRRPSVHSNVISERVPPTASREEPKLPERRFAAHVILQQHTPGTQRACVAHSLPSYATVDGDVKHKAPDARVFLTWSGEPISPHNVTRRWIVPACTKLGLRKATWLTFRRTYASWSHDQGVPGKVVAKLMGHTNVDVTLNIYTQAMDDSLRTAVDRVGNRLFNVVH